MDLVVEVMEEAGWLQRGRLTRLRKMPNRPPAASWLTRWPTRRRSGHEVRNDVWPMTRHESLATSVYGLSVYDFLAAASASSSSSSSQLITCSSKSVTMLFSSSASSSTTS